MAKSFRAGKLHWVEFIKIANNVKCKNKLKKLKIEKFIDFNSGVHYDDID